MSDGYSVFRSGGSWFVRWSEWHNGKRTQPSHKLCSSRFPKSEAKALASDYMTNTVGKATTIEAGSSVKEFVVSSFFPKVKSTLSRHTTRLYRQAWDNLQPHLGGFRLRDVRVADVQSALDAIYRQRGDTISHGKYKHCKVTCSAIFSEALRLGHHPGPNPEDGTSVRNYGHNNHRPNEAYSLEEIKLFLTVIPTGPLAVSIALNAFLALREPEVRALTPDDFDGHHVRIYKHTKTGNDELLPVIGPLRRILAENPVWGPICLDSAAKVIKRRIKGTNLKWKGWYAFRRGMATNLYKLGVRPEEAALILRNTPEVVRRHYIRLEHTGTKSDAMHLLEQAYDHCAVTVQ